MIGDEEIDRTVDPSYFAQYIETQLYKTSHIHRCISTEKSYLCYHLSNDETPAIEIAHPSQQQLQELGVVYESFFQQRKEEKIRKLKEEDAKEID